MDRSTIPSALDYGTLPDPALGLFDALLVEHDQPVLADEHIARLTGSMYAVYGRDLDTADLRARVDAVAAGCGGLRSRLQIDADPDGTLRLDARPASAPPNQPAVLVAFMLPGGMGPHKFRDRNLTEALIAAVPGRVPLLLDLDEAVLEAAKASVWIVERDALLTPPTDGRILPGVARATLLRDDPHAREEPFDLERLSRADAVFLTGSVAGRRPASLYGGA